MRSVLVPVFALVAFSAPACAGDLPAVVRDEMTRTAQVKPGATTVVFFTDFQCPYCRKTHRALAPIVAARKDRVRVVLRHVPLRRHPDARTAARAAICVERLASPEVAEAYADALYASPDLGASACESLALQRGVERDRYASCIADPATEARIEQDIAMFDAVKGDGVPLILVGRERLDGAQSSSSLAAALE